MNKFFKKLGKISLSLLMVLSCINLQGFKNVNALTLSPQATTSLTVLAEDINLPILGGTNLYSIKLGGTDAFCLAHGKKARNGNIFVKTNQKVSSEIAQVINWYKSVGSSGFGKDFNRGIATATIWAIQQGKTDVDNLGKIYDAVLHYYSSAGGNGADYVLAFYTNGILTASTGGTYYIWNYGASTHQPIVPISEPNSFIPDVDVGSISSEKSYSVTDSIELNIEKKDVDTKKGLANVKFDLYRDDTKIGTVTTDSDGKASYTFETDYSKKGTSTKQYILGYSEMGIPNQNDAKEEYPNAYTSKSSAQSAADAEALAKAKKAVDDLLAVKHTYKAVETATRKAYYLNPTTTTQSKEYASGDGTGSVTFSYTNKRQLGTINITKLDSETGNALDGATYVLKADATIIHPDGHTGTLYNKDDVVETFPVTDANGKSQLTNLYLGKYRIEETQAPNGYYRNPKVYYVELTSENSDASVISESTTVNDKPQRARVDLIKKDKELHNGTQNPNIVDGNKDGAQGDATRKGATYGLYAQNDIVHPDGKTGVISYNATSGSINELKATKGTDLVVKNVQAKANTLLATIKTDANGEFGFEHLYNGLYYVQEIVPSTGYLLDSTKYTIDLRYTNQDEEVISKNQIVLEQVKKQGFDIYKGGHTAGTSTNAKPLGGVQFTVKLESDVVRMGWDNAPTYDVITTKEDGTGSSIKLPFGYYRVRETKPAVDYANADDFFVTISNDSNVNQSYTNNVVIDEVFSAMIKAVKLDKESGKQVALPNAEFKIKVLSDEVYVDGTKFTKGQYIGYWNWNIFDGFYTDSWKTNDKGFVLINEKLSAGEYQLEEIHAPFGYVLDTTPVTFKVTNKGMYQIADDGKTPIITAYKSDVSVKGQITIEKRGEVLTGYKDGQFIYEEKGLANAKYNIIAKEDILDPSNDGSIIYKKGTVVDTVTTGEDGKAISKKLPLGAYEVQEIKAPHGMVLNKEKQTVVLEYADENTPVVFDDASFVNERQKVKLDLKKLDLDENVALGGVEFTMYANKDIADYKGNVIVKSGEAVKVAVSDKNGVIDFHVDLPLDLDSHTKPVDPNEVDGGFTVTTDDNGNRLIGDPASMFVIKETKRPVGYTTLHALMYIDTTYRGQDIKDYTIAYDMYNEMTRVEFSKTDITTGKPVAGAELSIIPVKEDGTLDEGATFATWITQADDQQSKEDESKHLVKGLEPGKYVLREKLGQASDLGYVTAQDVEFTVEDTGEIQRVEMKDDYTKVEISKTDITTGDYVVGTELSIIPVKEDGTLDLGTAFETWVTENGVHHIEYLPIGDYVLREKLQGQAWDYGYVTAEDVKFTVEDTSDLQKVEMKDDYTKVEISKTDITTGKPVVGAELSVFPVKEDGVLDEGATFVTWITDEDAKYIERIPVGQYILREKLGQAVDLGYVTANDVEFTVKDTGEIQRVEMKDDYTKVEISKTDVDNNYVKGATLAIVPLDEDGQPLMGEIFETWVTDGNAHHIDYLPIGHYQLVEMSAPDGFVKAQPVTFEVKDTGELQTVEMIEKQVSVSKEDLVNGSAVQGAELTVTDKGTGEIVDQWTSDETKHMISGLEEGKDYILTEVAAPDGFYTAESIEFTVSLKKENQEVIMKDAPILTDIQVNKVDKQTMESIVSKDFEFTMYTDEKCTQVLDVVHANTKEGTATFKDVRFGTYYIKETKAPKGYELSKEVKMIVVDQDLEGVGKVHSFVYLNTLLPTTVIKTSDNTAIGGTALLLGVSVIGMIATKKKKEETE